MEAAGERLDAALYEMSGYYAYLFRAASLRGVRTRVLLDSHPGANSTTVARLAGSPAACRLLPAVIGGRRVAGHWKLLVAGRDQLAVGTGNLIKRDAPRTGGLPGTREWWVFVDGSNRLADVARTAFEAAWQASVPPPAAWWRLRPAGVPAIGVPRPVVAPLTVAVPESALSLHLGGAACGAAVCTVVGSARRRLAVTVPYVRGGGEVVGDLLEAMSEAARRGVAVALLLGAIPGRRDAEMLAGLPFEVRVMDPARSTTGHAKGTVADGRVLVGSANWSSSGVGGNRESALLVDHPEAAAYYGAAFQRDWRVAGALEARGLGASMRRYAGHGRRASLVEAP